MDGDISGWSARAIEPITMNETFYHNNHRPQINQFQTNRSETEEDNYGRN